MASLDSESGVAVNSERRGGDINFNNRVPLTLLMAKTRSTRISKKRSSKTKKFYPAAKVINLLPEVNNQNSFLIRADHELSKINHRLYRQSRVYQLKLNLSPSFDPGTQVEVYAIAPTWMAMNAYKRAYETFLENSKEERSSTDARWHDFRVTFDGGQDNLLKGFTKSDVEGDYSKLSQGEYLPTEVHDSAGNTKTFSWMGTTASNRFNIIDEYDRHANTSLSPSNPTNEVPYDGLNDDRDAGQSAHLQGDGNEPPYASSTLDNDILVKIATLSANPQAQKLSTGFFDAPCGAILITTTQPIAQSAGMNEVVTLVCKEGDYKGVHAMNMLE